jgi:hypothetical protein
VPADHQYLPKDKKDISRGITRDIKG